MAHTLKGPVFRRLGDAQLATLRVVANLRRYVEELQGKWRPRGHLSRKVIAPGSERQRDTFLDRYAAALSRVASCP
jgi:hypothetical protein